MKVSQAKSHCWHVYGVRNGIRGLIFHASRLDKVTVAELLSGACTVMLQCCRPGCHQKMLIPGRFVHGHNRFREGWDHPCTGEVHEREEESE